MLLMFVIGCGLVEEAKEALASMEDTGAETHEGTYGCISNWEEEFLGWNNSPACELETTTHVVSQWSFGCHDTSTNEVVFQEIIGAREPCGATLEVDYDLTAFTTEEDTQDGWLTSFELEDGWVAQVEIPYELYQDYLDEGGTDLQGFSAGLVGILHFQE